MNPAACWSQSSLARGSDGGSTSWYCHVAIAFLFLAGLTMCRRTPPTLQTRVQVPYETPANMAVISAQLLHLPLLSRQRFSRHRRLGPSFRCLTHRRMRFQHGRPPDANRIELAAFRLPLATKRMYCCVVPRARCAIPAAIGCRVASGATQCAARAGPSSGCGSEVQTPPDRPRCCRPEWVSSAGCSRPGGRTRRRPPTSSSRGRPPP